MSKANLSKGLGGLVSYGHDSEDEGSDVEGMDDEEGDVDLPASLTLPDKKPSPVVSAPSTASSLVAYGNDDDMKTEPLVKEEVKEEQKDDNDKISRDADEDSRGPSEVGSKVAQPGEVGTIADISEDDDEDDDNRNQEAARLKLSIMSEPETALSMKIRRMSADEVTLPPEPKGRCSKQLQDKIAKYARKTSKMNDSIQRRKDFRNPSIYEKLISYLGIDELGTNYPKDMFDPHAWSDSSYYESLAKAQKEEMAKREKEKKERTKVEFVSGVKPSVKTEEQKGIAIQRVSTVLGDEDRKRKTKWDAPAPHVANQIPVIMLITTSITQPTVVSTTTSAKGAKTTIISAVGTIKKPKVEKKE